MASDDRRSANQETQRKMVEDAKKEPGVAEAIKVYDAIHHLTAPVFEAPAIHYGTGGNG